MTKADRIVGKIPFLTAGQENQGVASYIGNDWGKYKDPITVDMFGNCFFHNGIYSGDDNIYFFVSDEISNKAKLFIVNCISKQTFEKYSYGRQFRQPDANNLKALLSVKNGKIDFDFMESYIAELEAYHIAELEAYHIAELEAYLSVTGFKDYILTDKEEQALKDFENLNLSEVTFENIFNNIKQGRRLKSDDQIPGSIPFVMAGVTNNGVANYISNPVASFPGNSVTIDIFGNTFYRSYSFGAGDDTGVYWSSKNEYSQEAMLFFATAMEKSVRGKFSYGKKLRSSQSLDFIMQIPLKDNQPDFKIMETLISAVKKLVIRDIVLHSKNKIEATKACVGK